MWRVSFAILQLKYFVDITTEYFRLLIPSAHSKGLATYYHAGIKGETLKIMGQVASSLQKFLPASMHKLHLGIYTAVGIRRLAYIQITLLQGVDIRDIAFLKS